MRPVDKGIAPHTYSRYQDAGPDLQARLGDYCSYCERQIETNLAVEHIQPKSHVSRLRTSWSNFLLGCVNCNSSKGANPINVTDYFWPDVDNTLRAFKYTKGGIIDPSLSLSSSSLMAKADATIILFGLDKYPGNSNKARHPSSSDKRWLTRQQVWQCAETSWARLQKQPTNTDLREQIVETAIGRGLFSIWWTVFANDADMRQRFRLAFPGTDSGCFDHTENCQPRAGGQI